jgi:Leucine-rich repeat (LRR) protein
MKRWKTWKGGGPLLLLFYFVALVICQAEPPVPDDCKASVYEDGLALECSLSAINSADEKTNFSVVPADHTLSLTVKCRDPTLSQLEADGLRSLSHLKSLTLDGCHLRSIPARAFWGLTNLVSLTVLTRNAGVLAVEAGAFHGLPNLERLDLSGNYIRHLAPGVLCPLSKLAVLNLAKNEIGSLSDLGLTDRGCEMKSLRSLDMSSNGLSAVTAQHMTKWPHVQELRLANNYLRTLDRAAFTPLASTGGLNLLDLSNNQLSSLHRNVFKESTKLQTIVLANNTLSELPDTIFEAVSRSLQRLDLSGNFLTSITSRLVSQLANLTSLDMSSNEIESIHAQAFTGLSNLKTLRLDSNRVSKMPRSLLRSSKALHTLVLSDNALSRLSSQLFANLASLSHLLLDKNLLEDLPSSLFANTSSLTVLDLSHNRFTAIPEATKAKSMQSLQSLSLSGNLVSDLGSLQMPSLWRLQASDNKLANVTSSNLAGLPSLQVLDLSNNKIITIEKEAFSKNRPLKALRLDSNNLERMDNLFHDLADLSWLNVSANSISVFDYAMLPRGLTWFDLHQNAIPALGNYFSLEAEFTRLTHIDASFNRLTELGPQNVPNYVEILLLNDNQIATLVPYTFFKKTQLRRVDLTVNQIESIDRNALRLSVDVITKQQPEFLLGGNPIRCDCHMAWFKSVNVVSDSFMMEDGMSGNSLQQNFPKVADLESIYCQLLYSRDKSFVPLVEAATDEFLCTYKTHCFALCHCCEYDACDCEMTCPDNCTCYHDNSWSKNIAECSGSDFHDLPDQLPMDATEIFLDGNTVGELHSHTFIGRKNLKSLYLNHSLISSVQNHTFNGLAALQFLHLEGNSIKELQGDEFHGLRALKELYLQNNLIRNVNNATFRALESLEILYLHGNRLVDFPVWQLSFNPVLASIRLADNTWSCECQYVENFHNWLVKHSNNVPDSKGVVCVLDPNEAVAASASALVKTVQDDQIHSSSSHLRLLERNISTCQEYEATTHVQEKIARDYLPLLAATLAGFAVLAFLVILVFIYRDEVRVWLHSHYGVRFFQRIDDIDASDKIFDAFLTYSAKDDPYIRQILAPELEHGLSSHQYKLCLFYRDLPVQAYLAETIVQASDASRRTIIVLSENFLKSEWSRYDYKSGFHQALRTGRNKVIVIVLGNVESRDIDPDLRLYLKTSIVLYWGDGHFWEKLKYALPDVDKKANNRNSNTLFCGYNSMQLMSSESDTNSFRYETCPRRPVIPAASTASSGIYQTAASEQESTRTMTIHI